MGSKHWLIDVTFSTTHRVQDHIIDSVHHSFLSLSRVLSSEGDPHVEFLEGGQVLKVKSVRLRDQGIYQCLASNNAGTQIRQFKLTVQGLDFPLDLSSDIYCSFNHTVLNFSMLPSTFSLYLTINGKSETIKS